MVAPQSQVPVSIEDEMKSSFMDYAMSVIVARALPDARDGLKPVHRRILFAQHQVNVRCSFRGRHGLAAQVAQVVDLLRVARRHEHRLMRFRVGDEIHKLLPLRRDVLAGDGEVAQVVLYVVEKVVE